MRRANDSAQIVGVLYAIENYDQPCTLDSVLQLDIRTNRTKGNDTLVRNAVAGAVEQLARLKSHWH
jgi:hypothetical protein